MQNDQLKNGQPVSVGSTGGSAPGWRVDEWHESLGWCWRAYDRSRDNLSRRLKAIQQNDPIGKY